MYKLCTAVATGAAVFMSAHAIAQSPSKPRTSGMPAAEFVKKAVIGDMYEIQSSRLALEKQKGTPFEDFAQRIVSDHTKSGEELKSLAQGVEGVQVPNELDQQHKQMIDKLRSASGEDFTNEYRTQQIEAHQTAIRLYDGYSQNGDQPKLRSFAERTLPKLRQHLKLAEGLPRESMTVGQAPATTQKGTGQGANSSGQRADGQAQAERSGQVIDRLGPQHMRVSAILDANLYGANGENMGEIEDVVIGRNGELVAVVVEVGGFLGIGDKEVAIPFEALEIGSGSQGSGGQPTGRTSNEDGTFEPSRVVLKHMTRQDLEKAPSFSDD